MPNHTAQILLLIAVIWIGASENRTHFFYLQVLRFSQFLRVLPLRIRLEWDLYWIRHSRDKYLKMAEQITKELTECSFAFVLCSHFECVRVPSFYESFFRVVVERDVFESWVPIDVVLAVCVRVAVLPPFEANPILEWLFVTARNNMSYDFAYCEFGADKHE